MFASFSPLDEVVSAAYLLADVFGLHFEASPPGARDKLWATVLAGNRRWESANDM